MAERDHTKRNVVLVSGAGLAAWWLLSRGEGWGFRSTGDGREGTNMKPARAIVWVRRDRIEVDGVVSDLSSVIAQGRAAGEAEVHATGDAIMRSVRDVINGLRGAGVVVSLADNLTRTNWESL